jgi:hypothetical protein
VEPLSADGVRNADEVLASQAVDPPSGELPLRTVAVGRSDTRRMCVNHCLPACSDLHASIALDLRLNEACTSR